MNLLNLLYLLLNVVIFHPILILIWELSYFTLLWVYIIFLFCNLHLIGILMLLRTMIQVRMQMKTAETWFQAFTVRLWFSLKNIETSMMHWEFYVVAHCKRYWLVSDLCLVTPLWNKHSFLLHCNSHLYCHLSLFLFWMSIVRWSVHFTVNDCGQKCYGNCLNWKYKAASHWHQFVNYTWWKLET